MRALLERGHTVTYAAPFAAFDVEPFTDVRCVDLPRAAGRRRVRAVVAATYTLLVQGRAHDVVLVHDPDLLPSLFIAGLLPRRRRPVLVWDVHEDVPAQVEMVSAIPRLVRRPLAWLLHRVELLAERRVRLLLAEYSYQERFTRRHAVVPNSTRVPTDAALAQARTDTTAGPDRVVYLGAITAARGLPEMLAVAAALPPDVRLELIGNCTPEVDEQLRALPASSGVDYRGFLPNHEALSRLPGALVGLLLLHQHANYAHSQPTKLMEYMAHAVPAISTPNAAPAALLREYETGFVVPFGAVEKVVEHVLALRADPVLRRAMGERGHAAAVGHFDWNIDQQRFVDQLEVWVGTAA